MQATTDALIQRLHAAINAHDLDAIDACYHDDVTNHGRRVGRGGMRTVHEAIFGVFPDFALVAEELITTSDRAVLRGRLTGTHRAEPPVPLRALLFGGALDGVEPTGRPVGIDAIHVWEVTAGLVSAHWAVRDDLSLRRQVLPPNPT